VGAQVEADPVIKNALKSMARGRVLEKVFILSKVCGKKKLYAGYSNPH